MKDFMTRAEIQTRIRELRVELEARVKSGVVKIADTNGQPIPTKKLQNELYALLYKASKIE